MTDHDDAMGIDLEGRPLPMTATEVKAHMRTLMEDGDIVMCVVRGTDGDLACPVFGPPSQELLEILERVTSAYRVAIRGH